MRNVDDIGRIGFSTFSHLLLLLWLLFETEI